MSVMTDSGSLWLIVKILRSPKNRSSSGNYMVGQVCVISPAENNPSIKAVQAQTVWALY